MIDQAELMKSVLAVLQARNVSLSESPTRILMMLPTRLRLRVNVTVIDAQNEPLTATLMLDQEGQVTCKLATDPADTVVDISRYRV